MPKDTKTLGNNKARAWESLGFAHKKRLCQHFDTTSLKVIITICNFSEAHFSFDSLLAKCISLYFRLIKECPYSSAWNFLLTFIRLME